MPRISYEQIAPEANILHHRMVMSRTDEAREYWRELYVALLEGAGWTVLEFEREEGRRVDKDWDTDKPAD